MMEEEGEGGGGGCCWETFEMQKRRSEAEMVKRECEGMK